MFVQTGYIYHIKDDFFKTINDKGLMINHENGRSRPTYLTIVENDILWFIPLSSKVSKYKTIIKQKIQKYGKCNTILIRTIAGRKVVILLQNAFPTLEKYIDHPHIRNGVPHLEHIVEFQSQPSLFQVIERIFPVLELALFAFEPEG